MFKFLAKFFQSNEQRWVSGTEPAVLRELIPPGMQTQRRLRLYGVACCERISHLIVHPDSKASVALGLKLADGLSDSDLQDQVEENAGDCLLYTSPSPRDRTRSRMPSSA